MPPNQSREPTPINREQAPMNREAGPDKLRSTPFPRARDKVGGASGRHRDWRLSLLFVWSHVYLRYNSPIIHQTRRHPMRKLIQILSLLAILGTAAAQPVRTEATNATTTVVDSKPNSDRSEEHTSELQS